MTNKEAIKWLKSLRDVTVKHKENEKAPRAIESIDLAIKALEERPQYQSPPGKWIYKCCYGDEYPQCSNCGEIFDEKSNFCPDCGADMRGGAE